MKTLHFQIEYHTQWGEHLEIVYSTDGARPIALPMSPAGNDLWQADLPVSDHSRHIRHAYRVADESGRTVRNETDTWRIFYFNHRTEVFFCDAWSDHPLSPLFHRSAFSKTIMTPRGADKLHMEMLSSPCLLILHTRPSDDGRLWAVVGESEELGKWDIARARTLQRTGTYEWTLPIMRGNFENGTRYKYVLIDPLDPKNNAWEEGTDRKLQASGLPSTASVVRQDDMPAIHLKPWRGAGVVVPVFSLKSESSWGIGDFGDLSLFIRWAADTGLKAVQLLPINDTTRGGTWRDSYPYNGISVLALHPLYINTREWRGSKAFEAAKNDGEKLNLLPDVDYEEVFKLKMQFLRKLFEEIGAATLRSGAFRDFKAANDFWLKHYTLFCACRDRFGTANFRSWPRKHGTDEIAAPSMTREQNFYAFVQYLLHRQMLAAHTEASELGVILKGDIPIGVCPDSVPAWVDTRLFHFDGSAGAPPDDFARHGQNWGFPTYNWDEMAKDGYLWWRNRLAHMAQYFDAYRIDHVLGFFRIWEIPAQHIDGILGRFRPALPLSEEEIKGYGFTANVEHFYQPLISTGRYESFKEKWGDEAAAKYLEKTQGGYTLQKPYLAQRAIAAEEKNDELRRALLDIVTEVLFIADPEKEGLFHPRISPWQTGVFQMLTNADQQAFGRLHEDFFYHRHNQFWADEAMKKIPVVAQCQDSQCPSLRLFPLEGDGMLPCAEDLGMVPSSVKAVLQRLDILSLEIQRMPKEGGMRFADLSHNPYMSVATIATHDMPPLRLWWRENKEQTEQFWHEVLGHEGNAPEEATPQVCEDIVKRHVNCPSMLCLLALQDWLAISPSLRSNHPENEQINVPANPDQYWRYRMHVTIEELIRSTGFNEKLRGILQSCR